MKNLISSSGGLKNIRINDTTIVTIAFRIEKYAVNEDIEIILKVDDSEKGCNFEITGKTIREVEEKMGEKVRSTLKSNI